MYLNYSIISTKSSLIYNTHMWSFMTPKTKQCKLTVKGRLPTHQKEPPTFQANIITFTFIYFTLGQMQHRCIKSTKNNSSFLMAFSLLKDIGSIPSPPSKGRVASDVSCIQKNVSCHNKKGRKERKNITNFKSGQESGYIQESKHY